MRFLSQLKSFFNDKGLDLTPILKSIFQAFNMKEKSVSIDFEGSYWQLLNMIFAGLYLDSGSDNVFLRNFFVVDIKVDVLLLRMVLDIITKTLKQVDPSAIRAPMHADAFEKSDFL